jgi:uncharacterized protein YbjT (DUF2867 family)
MILVTGATGQTGGAVLQSLLVKKAGPIRVTYRDDKDRATLPPGVEAVRADFADAASLAKALAGVQSAYLVCAPIPQLVELEGNFLQAAANAKLPYLVLQSALGAADFPKSFPSWHRKVEERARELKLSFSTLRPNGFMQNIAGYFGGTIKSQDAFYDALGEARLSYVDVRDVGDAAAKLLITRTGVGEAYELSGPEALTNAEVAQRISKVVGRTVRYVPLTLEQMKQGMIGAGMPEARATPVVELYEYYLSGKGAGSDGALRTLLDHPPRTLEQYLAEVASLLSK